MIKNGTRWLMLFVGLVGFYVRAEVSGTGFIVTALDDRFRVNAPNTYKPTMEVVVENKTLSKLIGKVTVNFKNQVKYISIGPEKYQKVLLQLNKGDQVHFVPLSPAFQEVELIIGNKTYEVPPKR